MKIIRNYVSELDQFLQTFNKKHQEPSYSQRKEKKNFDRVAKLRDRVNVHGDKPKVYPERPAMRPG